MRTPFHTPRRCPTGGARLSLYADVLRLLTPFQWKALQIAVVLAIGVYTYRKKMLNVAGAATAAAMGITIVLATNIWWLALLFALLAMGSAATRFRFADKQSRHVAEKAGGRRSTKNVLANGLPAALLAVLAPLLDGPLGATPVAVAYASAVAVAASDTLASEFGSLADRVYMITTFRRVPAGTDGGFSAVGQFAALGGGFILAVLAAFFLGFLARDMRISWLALGIPTLCGFVGCQVDSLLGATLEGEGLLTKEEVNGLSIAVGGILGLLLAVLWL